MRKLAYVLAWLLLFLHFTYSAFDDFKESKGKAFALQLENWQAMAISAVLICISFNVLLYMAGKALQSDHLKRHAQAEFLQVSASSLMIFFAVQLLYTLSTGSAIDLMGDILGKGSHVACGAAPNGKFLLWEAHPQFGTGPLGAFRCKLQEKITALDSAFNSIYYANLPMERLDSTCYMLFGIPVYCGSWDRSVHNKVEEAHLLATKITSLLMPLHAQYVLATYIENNMLSVFLPLGLVLRIFPLTRGVGGLFIAIAIGFFFVFPIFFILTDPTFVKVDTQEAPNQDRQPAACFSGFKGSAIILQTVLGEQGGGAAIGGEELAIEDGKMLLFQLTISIMFYPFVALVVALIFVRAMTPLLGGDLGELMRMVSRLG
ncbi:MAG: hypothetical protein QW275_00380 [Candidatus Anstonellaceae archaeon]